MIFNHTGPKLYEIVVQAAENQAAPSEVVLFQAESIEEALEKTRALSAARTGYPEYFDITAARLVGRLMR